MNENNALLNLFHLSVKSDESKVLEKFIAQKAKFAIVREDIMYKFLENRKLHNTKYYIIGKLSAKAVLYFFSHKNHKMTTIEMLQNKKISIGMMGDETNRYLKNILKKENIPYTVHLKIIEFYHALHALKFTKIDAMFVFGNQNYRKKFIKYIQEYPKGFMSSLKEEKGLECKKNDCYVSYYLLSSDTVNKPVMHNIYKQVEPILSKNKELTSNLGQYYIDTTYKQKRHVSKKTIEVNKEIFPKFGRAPWMDVAIKEAILGKGSSENTFPMLNLSYKYIRFAKGNKGITTAPNDSKFGAWCAAYVCWTLNKSGFSVHKTGRMASQSFRYFKDTLYKKIDKPIFGAIVLYTSKVNPLHGHIGYLIGHTIQGDNILLGGNQNNRLKFASYPSHGFGSYRFNGFYIPKNYSIKKADTLTRKDIYTSVQFLNKLYGVKESSQSKKVR
ncbi:MAG: hypothetical protein L3J43_05030 [Sulfurovum sp.]|nr:hypothetical protein [Sulfurovum sp.]